MSVVELTELVPAPAAGRVFERALRPGIADATGSGRVRLDAIARWLQDVAYLDLVDAGFEWRGRVGGAPAADPGVMTSPGSMSRCTRHSPPSTSSKPARHG